jgi:hypothetical protein
VVEVAEDVAEDKTEGSTVTVTVLGVASMVAVFSVAV